jgi:hypothetical protein
MGRGLARRIHVAQRVVVAVGVQVEPAVEAGRVFGQEALEDRA